MGRRLCFHEIDVLGGWISDVVVLFIVDAAALAILLLVSAKDVNSTWIAASTRSDRWLAGVASPITLRSVIHASASNLFILTGAPGSGKTAILARLRDELWCVDEPAREVLAEQRASGGSGTWDQNPSLFVHLLLQRSIEKYQMAVRSGKKAVFDRGIPDCVVYAIRQSMCIGITLTRSSSNRGGTSTRPTRKGSCRSTRPSRSARHSGTRICDPATGPSMSPWVRGRSGSVRTRDDRSVRRRPVTGTDHRPQTTVWRHP